ncbi:MAG: radical SAM protein [Candidatus Adiutrix sp.]
MKLPYLALWFFKARFLKAKNPLQTVLFISDKCNLTCRHCNIYSKSNPIIKTYETIKEELEYAYGLGSRFVDFEGGEPLLWADGSYTLNSLFDLAKKVGFYSSTLTTNAQLPFDNCRANSIWVSLDGLGHYHEQIRGEGTFERLVKNVAEAKHPNLSLNMVINRLNYPSVKETIEFANSNKHIKSIALNFHTPFNGCEDLCLDWEQRSQVIDEIIQMKQAGSQIMNSVSGLKLMKKMDFATQCWVTNFIMADGSRLAECQGKRDGVCDRCGLAMAGEMKSVFTFKPDTILAGLKLRVKH